MTTIGGSEVGKLINDGADKFVDYKIHNQSNYFCIWGQLFEPVAIQWIKNNCIKYDFASCDTIFDSRLPISFTPDGFLYTDDLLFLVEIKCPFYRSIYSDVLDTYLAQLRLGMEILNIKMSKLFRFQFRACCQLDLTKKHIFNFNRKTHRCRFQFIHKLPIMAGYFTFDDISDVKSPVDLSVNIDLLEKIDIKSCKTTYVSPDDFVPIDFDKPFLCWKLFDCVENDVSPDSSFLTKNSDIIWDAYKKLESNTSKNEL